MYESVDFKAGSMSLEASFSNASALISKNLAYSKKEKKPLKLSYK